MSNKNSWEIYSKILSQDDISLVYDENADTAYYELENKCVHIPTFTFLNEVTTQLLVSHEIGHAKFTKYTREEFIKYTKKFGDLFNIVEDAYIERMMKKTFNGLNSIFKDGYKQLCDNKFMNVNIDRLNEYNISEKLNIYSKMSYLYQVPFNTKEENMFAYRIMNLNSNKDVIDLCTDIISYLKKKKEKDNFNKISENNNTHKEENNNDSSLQSDPIKTDSNSLKNDDMTNDIENDKTCPRINSDAKNDHINDNSDIKDDLTDSIQEDFNENIKEYGEFINSRINKNKKTFIYNKKNKGCYNMYKYIPYLKESYNKNRKKFSKEYKMINDLVNHVSMTFKQHKSAMELKNSSYQRVGKLDIKRISKYKTTENIFKNKKLSYSGEDHGIVILIDLSGSMRDKIYITFIQACIFAQFCKINSIPFEIISFGGLFTKNKILNYNGIAKLGDNLNFSIESFMGLYHFSRNENFIFDFSSTPTIEGLIEAGKTIENFKKYGIQKTSLYIVTDGEHNLHYINDNNNFEDITNINSIVYDNIMFNIDNFIDKKIIHNDWIVELFCARIKKLYDTYISITYIDGFDYLMKNLSYEIKSKYNINTDMSNHISTFTSDEYFYLYKHGYYFDNFDIPKVIKNGVLTYNFKNNPFIDQYQNFVFFDIDLKNNEFSIEKYLTNYFKNTKVMKVLVDNFIKNIA